MEDNNKTQVPQLFRREELPEKLKCSQRFVDELLATRALKSLKIGRRRLVSENQLASFIRKQELAAK